MVWFYHVYIHKEKPLPNILSIPLWSDFILFDEKIRCSYLRCFQSHYGLILSIWLLTDFMHLNDTFQSHYGLILSWGFGMPRIRLKKLSIPLWSDFILVEYARSHLVFHPFQSHYGLILSNVWDLQKLSDIKDNIINSLTFNPTMVWFYLEIIFQQFFACHFLSIPLWSDFILNFFISL